MDTQRENIEKSVDAILRFDEKAFADTCKKAQQAIEKLLKEMESV